MISHVLLGERRQGQTLTHTVCAFEDDDVAALQGAAHQNHIVRALQNGNAGLNCGTVGAALPYEWSVAIPLDCKAGNGDCGFAAAGGRHRKDRARQERAIFILK